MGGFSNFTPLALTGRSAAGINLDHRPALGAQWDSTVVTSYKLACCPDCWKILKLV